MWQEYIAKNTGHEGKSQFVEKLHQLDGDQQLVTYTSLYVHLLDQFVWGLLSGDEVMPAGNELLAVAAAKFSVPAPVISKPELQEYSRAWGQLTINIVE